MFYKSYTPNVSIGTGLGVCEMLDCMVCIPGSTRSLPALAYSDPHQLPCPDLPTSFNNSSSHEQAEKSHVFLYIH